MSFEKKTTTRALRTGVLSLAAAAAATLAPQAAWPLDGYAIVHAMSGEGGADGQGPNGDLAAISSGYLFGTNFYLGASAFRCGCTIGGTVFKVNLKGKPVALHTFSGPDGMAPSGGLVQGPGKLWFGTTAGGGDYGGGTVFEISGDGSTFSVLHSFNGPAKDGAYPWHAPLVMAGDGNFYGTTMTGGANGLGTIFRISPAGAFAVVHQFAGGAGDGAQPRGGLLLGSDGNLYGTALCGGNNDKTAGVCSGVVYRLGTDGSFQVLHNFDGTPKSVKGYQPQGGLAEAGGQLYGTTTAGGASGYGTIFRLGLDGTGFTDLHDFLGGVQNATANDEGAAPVGRLVVASDGALYGTTSLGGTNATNYPKGDGTIFRITQTGTYTTLYSFGAGTSDGAHPVTGLVQGPDGALYGTTETGGANQTGTIFKFPLPPL